MVDEILDSFPPPPESDYLAEGAQDKRFNLTSITGKYLVKLEALAREIFDAWVEYSQIEGSKARTSMGYVYVNNEALSKASAEAYAPHSSGIMLTEINPKELLRSLKNGHQFDPEPETGYSPITANPSNRGYSILPGTSFVKQVRSPVLAAVRNRLKISLKVPAVTTNLDEMFNYLGIYSYLDLDLVGGMPHMNLGVKFEPLSDLREGPILDILSVRNVGREPKFSISGLGREDNITKLEDLETEQYRRNVQELVERLVRYDLSVGGQVAPIGIFALQHLAATKKLLTREAGKISEAVKDLETVLEEI